MQPLKLRFAAFELDEADSRLLRDGVPIALAPKALAVLCALARQSGRLVMKNDLLDLVWGHQHVSESVLKTIISELRAALGDDARQPRYIETAARLGYRFIAEAITAPAARATDPPPASASSPDGSIVGRTDALARLHQVWRDARDGRVRVVWVAGEAGIGKTTLIDHFTATSEARVARGQCVEQYGAGEPYLPVLEALSGLCQADPALAPLLRTVAPTWAIQLPWLSSESERESLRRELAGASQERMLREFGELLDRLPEPLLLVTEDLHWSDQGTLQLINHVARRRGRARLLWLASLRLAEVIAEDHPLKPLRHELRAHRLVDEILLEPFSEQELADYLARRAPRLAGSEALIRMLHRRTDGLPLFIVSVMDELASADAADTESTDETLRRIERGAETVPESLAGIIEKQVVRLEGNAQRFLEAASVCGVDFRLSTVAAVLDRPADWVATVCDALARQRQWLKDPDVERLSDGRLEPRCAFRHALYRHVFYGRVGALERAQLHRRVAAALTAGRTQGVPAPSSELASHFELGHEPMAALKHYAEAAESALRRFAPAEAVTLSSHALALVPQTPPGPGRDALHLALAGYKGAALAQLRGISSPDARAAFEAALVLLDRLPGHPLRGLVLQGYGIVLMVRGENAQAQALAERAHAMSNGGADPVLFLSACSVLGQVNALQGRQREARGWLERGIACCEALGESGLQSAFVVDPAVTLHATLALPLLHLGEIGGARRQAEHAKERAQRLGEPMARMVAGWFGAFLASRLEDYDTVGALGEAMLVVSRDAALAQGQAANQWFRGHALAHRARPRDGYALIREAFDANAALGMYSGGTEVLGYAAEALLMAGELPAAEQHLDEADALARRLDERVYLPQLLLLRARVHEAQGDGAAARRMREAALAEARGQDNVWFELMALAALVTAMPADKGSRKALAALLARVDDGDPCAPLSRARRLLAA